MACLAAEVPTIGFALRCRSASPSFKARTWPAQPAVEPPHKQPSPQAEGPGPPPTLPVRSLQPASLRLPLWPASAALRQLCALAAELQAAWAAAGAEEAARLADTEAIAAAALAELRPRLEAWRRRVQELEGACRELRRRAQAGIDELDGEHAEALSNATSLPLHEQLTALEDLLSQVDERLKLARRLRAERRQLLDAFGRPAPDDRPAAVPRLEAQVSALRAERGERLASVSRAVAGVRAVLQQLSLEPPERDARTVLSGGGFGLADAEHGLLLERLAFWEAEAARRLAARGSAERVAALCAELGEAPEAEDGPVLALLEGGAGGPGAAAGPAGEPEAWPELLALLDRRRAAWEARRAAAAAELARLHGALRGFGDPELAEEAVREHGSLHRKDREACRRLLREFQAALLEAEAPARERLRRIYEAAGLEARELEAFFASLEEAGTAGERGRRLAEELERMEAYFASVGGILAQLEELQALVSQGARFEAARAAEKERFSGNSLHFLEEERFRKMFAKRYPLVRDQLISKIETWEADRAAAFVYRGSAVRERLVAMRGAEADLLQVPGDLGLVGMLLQMLDIKEVTVVNRRPPQGRRPPRDPSAPELRASPAARGRGGRPASRTPTPPRRSLSVPRARA